MPHRPANSELKMDVYQVRAYFLARHSSIKAWAKENGINHKSVSFAINYRRTGRRYQEILRRLSEEMAR